MCSAVKLCLGWWGSKGCPQWEKFQLRDYPRSGSKAMNVERRKKEEERAKVSNNNGQYKCLDQLLG